MLSWPLLVIVVGCVGLYIVRQTVLNPTSQAAPRQPIDFPHTLHSALIPDCTFCHRTAHTEAAAGLPALQQCMFCHQVAGREREEVQKLLAAWDDGETIDWVRVHQVPDHVQFVHEAHIRAGFDCSTCHGAVQEMERVRQVRDLRMDDCVACHQENNAPTDCTTCHY